MLGKAFVSFSELNTVLCEVEYLINDRSLTYVSDSFDRALTPSCLHYGRPIKCLANTGMEADELKDPSVFDHKLFTEREMKMRFLLEHYWKAWRREYLVALRDRNLVRYSNKTLTVGDLVLVHEEASRSTRNVAKVVTLREGHDGVVRVAALKTLYGIVTRPITRLLPLEISSTTVQSVEPNAPVVVVEIKTSCCC